MILRVVMLMMSFFHIHSSGNLFLLPFHRGLSTIDRARRNVQGHLEPDADDETVQKSLGFDRYENVKVETRSNQLTTRSSDGNTP